MDQLPNLAPHEVTSIHGILKDSGELGEQGSTSLQADVLQNLLPESMSNRLPRSFSSWSTHRPITVVYASFYICPRKEV